MPRTITKIIDIQGLHGRGKSAIIIIQLMMACNDISVANEALKEWQQKQSKIMRSRLLGAKRYFVRLQIGHLHEAIKIIGEIKENNELMALLGCCDTQTQKSFNDVINYFADPNKKERFEKIAGRIRHNLTFHYDKEGKLISKAIESWSGRHPTKIFSTITRGSTNHLWHFTIADDILDDIVVRKIWKIESSDPSSEADNIINEIQNVCLSFINFCGEFIWRYFPR